MFRFKYLLCCHNTLVYQFYHADAYDYDRLPQDFAGGVATHAHRASICTRHAPS